MVFVYGQAGENGREAARMYRAAYTERQQHPHHRTCGAIYRHLCELGSFETDERAGRPRTVCTPDVDEHVFHDIEKNPGTSSRQMTRQRGVRQRTVICMLHDNRQYLYHLQRVQILSPADLSPWERYCRWFVQQAITIMGFLSSVLLTDEATFGHDDVINMHNHHHLWSTDNPHGMVEASHQERFSINRWEKIIGDRLLGTVLIPRRLNGETHLTFLQNPLPPLLENVPVGIRQTLWLQHDGAPVHFCINVRQHLNIFPRR